MRQQENKAIDRFLIHHLDGLQQHLRAKLYCDEDAKDLAQEACLNMLQIRQPEAIQNPKAYLYRIANNLLYRHYNNRWRTRLADVEIESIESAAPCVDDIAILNTRLQQIEHAIRELPPKCQQALRHRWRDGLQVAEIAEQMSLSQGMVKKYLATGIGHFRKRLSRYVVADQAA